MIPIPMVRAGHGQKYPWERFVELGYSEFFETERINGVILTSAKYYFERRGIKAKFTTRRLVEDGKKGIRIWRVE